MKKTLTYPSSPNEPPPVVREALPTASAFRASAAPAAMRRTQIYLSEAEHEFLARESARRAQPMAAVIRSFIDEKMNLPEGAWTDNPLLAPPADETFAGPADGALHHDLYIYGAPESVRAAMGREAPASAPGAPPAAFRFPRPKSRRRPAS
jgi:hypothetical protein